MSPSNNENGFFQYGNDRTNLDHSSEDALVGDEKGLLYLRDKINEAVNTKAEVSFQSDDIDTDFTHLQLGKRIPNSNENDGDDRFFIWGCLLAVLLILVIFVFGIIKIFELFT